MKFGFYSPYLDTFGGGERYMLTLASHLAQKNSVDIFWEDSSVKAPLARFLKIDLAKTNFVDNIFSTPIKDRFFKTRVYDLIFVLSDGSIPFSFAKKNILHFQVPFIFPNIKTSTKFKLTKYNHIVVNSNFTKKFIDRSFHIDTKVIYPPVDLDSIKSGKKEKIILSVGRFSAHQLHPKKQEILIEVFKEFYKKKPDWKLVLVGQSKKEDQKYVRRLRKLSKGWAIKIVENLPIDMLLRLYSIAPIYWHATGFGEDESNHPERMEHFGISTVEASAAGCVPLVINRGGQKEIVEDNKTGFLWETKTQLYDQTLKLIGDKTALSRLSRNAIKNSKKFSKGKFLREYEKIIFE
ncbi:hypothetical protein A3A54_00925 [Candidatus Curtissbacteria bacterium RIFCSPLOWO2_01_FULL_39_62]|uniref:Glycosyl transferase family 1 domain-containing protein n=1 Tax=Candidatus Curtissbacteria bacterium RIFCSPLOWO2_12_FULL_38_9 TaxID=1797735 RepID=A0A1F5I7D6_9BACT|nr:MAG: hypothetical protein A3E11_01870 [Candidatus Curtissbacteria bacterium RIFCSPHIGHO2_12_FULL_38_37]OGE01849.1 MAG: hypothetical protein A3A54_00925 [Candidatus Curtissbacteria bacterium RIFCSPLOWO2_01_FULL_39_62]OGE12308.1 MAG: hypothetical protein A3G14_03585 [Candidatus Curtissbacteria bacterium RIFCSPLOWO2_12_FULL_38_9]